MAIITYVYILAAFFVADSFSQGNFHTCSGEPAPKSVNIAGCNSLPCTFKRGTYVHAAIEFAVTENTKTLRPVVDVEVGGGHLKYPLPQQNACKGLSNAECPLDKGEVATYELSMPIEKIYPLVSVTIQFSLYDDKNKSQVCIKIPAKVVA